MSLAVQIRQHGGPEELHIVDVPVGEPGPGEVRIRHHAVGLNFIDVYHRTGLYPLNMPATIRFRRIILPQALLAAIAPGTNLLIELLKNTSLVSLITLSDLSFRARQLDQATFQTLEIFSLTLLLYFVLAQVINFLMRRVERRLSRGRLRGSLS